MSRAWLSGGMMAVTLEEPKVGYLSAAWRPRKSVTVRWRRVETIAPDDYAAIVAWLTERGTPDEAYPLLLAMGVNEVAVEPVPVLAELRPLLDLAPPTAVAEAVRLLIDTIWEASDPDSDWLTWRPCAVCGRRWSTTTIVGVTVCPLHGSPQRVADYLRAEETRFNGLVDHAATLQELAGMVAVMPPRPPAPVGLGDLSAAEQAARDAAAVARVERQGGATGDIVDGMGDEEPEA